MSICAYTLFSDSSSPSAAKFPLCCSQASSLTSCLGVSQQSCCMQLVPTALWCLFLKMGLLENSWIHPADTRLLLHLPDSDFFGNSCSKFPWTSHSSSPLPQATQTQTPPWVSLAGKTDPRKASLACAWPGLGWLKCPCFHFSIC